MKRKKLLQKVLSSISSKHGNESDSMWRKQ